MSDHQTVLQTAPQPSRYHIADEGGVLPYRELLDVCVRHGFEPVPGPELPFVLETVEDDDRNPRLRITVELAPGRTVEPAVFAADVAESVGTSCSSATASTPTRCPRTSSCRRCSCGPPRTPSTSRSA
jgi:hypothetical protein